MYCVFIATILALTFLQKYYWYSISDTVSDFSQRSFWRSYWIHHRRLNRHPCKRLWCYCYSCSYPCSTDTRLSTSFHRYHTLNYFKNSLFIKQWKSTWGIVFRTKHHTRRNDSAFTIIIFSDNVRAFRVCRFWTLNFEAQNLGKPSLQLHSLR